MSTATLVTPEELLSMPDGKSYELVGGQLLEREMSVLSSFVAGELFARLREYVTSNELGWVFVADMGYRCFPHDPSRVRKPDVSFVGRDKLAADEIDFGWCPVVPDLVVEVISPNDRASELEIKLGDYREAGVPVVWFLYPETVSAHVHRHDGPNDHLTGDVEFVGEGPLEGFRCRFADLLPRHE